MAVTYNLEHAQVAPVAATPTYLDVPGVITMDVSISSSSNYLAADGGKYAVAWSAPEGSGTLSFGESDFAVLAVINGGTASSSGITPAVIDRYEQPGTVSNPSFILVGYAKNVKPADGADARAGFRVTVPRASAAPASMSMGQETWGEWSADLAFVADDNDVMVIYEMLETAPTFTNGVTTTNLVAPA
jgi:hypothetical protein